MPLPLESIVLGGGCFWCIEAVLNDLKGVESAVSGFAGGTTTNPTYDQVATGSTGHAEVVKVTFDPAVISLHDLLTVFFTLHDPTTLNRQGADSGTEYRSIVLYSNEEQKQTATAVMKEIEIQEIWEGNLVTELKMLEEFYPADEYQQKYFEKFRGRAYCQIVIEPKVAKLRKLFLEKLKSV